MQTDGELQHKTCPGTFQVWKCVMTKVEEVAIAERH